MGEKWVLSDKYVKLVKDTYERAYIKVRTCVGLTERFLVTVDLHQGSSLSSSVIDVLTAGSVVNAFADEPC